VNHIQSTLQSHLPHDEPTIDVDFKWFLKYKLLYMSRNVHLNIMMIILYDLIENHCTNIWMLPFTIMEKCPFWHINSKFETQNYDNSSSNNSKWRKWRKTSYINKFDDTSFFGGSKEMDYEIIITLLPQMNISIFKVDLKINIQKNKKFQCYFMAIFDNFLKVFHINK